MTCRRADIRCGLGSGRECNCRYAEKMGASRRHHASKTRLNHTVASRDEEAHPFPHPALKHRAKVTPPLRGEERRFFHAFSATKRRRSRGENYLSWARTVSQRLTAQQGVEPRGEVVGLGRGLVSQRLTALRAAEPRELEPEFFHTFYATKGPTDPERRNETREDTCMTIGKAMIWIQEVWLRRSPSRV